MFGALAGIISLLSVISRLGQSLYDRLLSDKAQVRAVQDKVLQDKARVDLAKKYLDHVYGEIESRPIEDSVDSLNDEFHRPR